MLLSALLPTWFVIAVSADATVAVAVVVNVIPCRFLFLILAVTSALDITRPVIQSRHAIITPKLLLFHFMSQQRCDTLPLAAMSNVVLCALSAVHTTYCARIWVSSVQPGG